MNDHNDALAILYHELNSIQEAIHEWEGRPQANRGREKAEGHHRLRFEIAGQYRLARSHPSYRRYRHRKGVRHSAPDS